MLFKHKSFVVTGVCFSSVDFINHKRSVGSANRVKDAMEGSFRERKKIQLQPRIHAMIITKAMKSLFPTVYVPIFTRGNNLNKHKILSEMAED